MVIEKTLVLLRAVVRCCDGMITGRPARYWGVDEFLEAHGLRVCHGIGEAGKKVVVRGLDGGVVYGDKG
jgi:hypothetical protein